MWQWVDLFIRHKTKHLITFNRIYVYLSKKKNEKQADNELRNKYEFENYWAQPHCIRRLSM